MADLIVIIGVCVLLIIFYYVFSSKTTIPGPTPLPLVGNLLVPLREKPGQHYIVYKELAKKYGDIYRLFMGRQLVVRLNSYDIMREAFVEKAAKFSGRPDFLQNEHKGIMCNFGKDYRTLRAFFLNKMMNLDEFLTKRMTHEDRILRETETIKRRLSQSSGEPIVVNKLLFAAGCNVILDIFFGIRYDFDDETLENLVNAVKNYSKNLPQVSLLGLVFPFLQPILPKFERQATQLVLYNYADSMIKECRNTFDENNVRCLIDVFIQAEKNGIISGDAFSDSNILCGSFDNLLPGIGSPAYLLSWCIAYMVLYPEVQNKCRDEIHKIVGSERKVTLSDRENLRYVQATLWEVERYTNLAAIAIPHVATEDGTLKGHHIPKGTILVGDILAAYSLDIVEDDKFDPERWRESNGDLKKYEKNIFYGIGPRRCLGGFLADIESFLIFSNLIQHFTFTKASPSDDFNFTGHLGLVMITPEYEVRADESVQNGQI